MTKTNSLSNLTFTAKLTKGKLLENKILTSSMVRMRVSDLYAANTCQPGQFINIKVSDNFFPLLRRPFSIHRVDKKQGWFEILYQILGRGTKLLANFQIGDEVEFFGPLGNGYVIPEKLNPALLVAGGLGVASLLFLSQELAKRNVPTVLFWGNRTKEAFAIIQDFEELGVEIYLATDDGSLGFKGTVTEFFQKKIENYKKTRVQIFACGPNPMLIKLQTIVGQENIPCQMSLETMMGCGFGVCMGCNILSTSASEKYKYICKDGPVFDSGEIKFSD